MAESSNWLIALDKPIKTYIQEQMNKKNRAKTTRKYAVSIIVDKEFYQARKRPEARSTRLAKKTIEGQQIERSCSVDWWRGKHFYEKYLH